MDTVSTIGKAVFAAALGATATALAAVNFVECPKCDKRIRISEDGRQAFVNMSRIDQARKSDMKARAERLLEMARPVKAADPATPLMGWSSWNTFALDISEDIIVGVARTMATNGLKAAGYVYVNIDPVSSCHSPASLLYFGSSAVTLLFSSGSPTTIFA